MATKLSRRQFMGATAAATAALTLPVTRFGIPDALAATKLSWSSERLGADRNEPGAEGSRQLCRRAPRRRSLRPRL
ncbi:MAG: hypothetical protein KatS3mg059_0665 [Thermomicrobiales bacterium]|nr:MAG: hypothetical protein KatS3mg059_0665 [Thermomicrobiales bacterium]